MSHPLHTRLQRILGKKIFAHDVQIDGELSVTKDTDSVSYFGRAYVGYDTQADSASFGHLDHRSVANYALTQNSDGSVNINSPTGKKIYFRVNNIVIATIDVDSVDISQPLTLTGDARVHRHEWAPATTFRKSGATEGQQGINTHLIFRNNFDDIASYTTYIHYARAADTDLDIELLWYYTGGNQGGDCKWNLTYLAVAHEGEDPTAAGTALSEQAVNIATDDTTGHVHFTIPAAALAEHDTLFLKVWRNGDDDTLGTDALFLGVHIHYVMGSLGQPVV